MQHATTRPEADAPARRRRRFPRPRWPSRATWLRSACAVAGGLLMYAAFPPSHLWWLVPIAFALFVLPLLRRRARAGFGYGLLFGLAWLLPLLSWLNTLLYPQFGPWPWLALSVASALLVAVAAAAMAVASVLPAAPVWLAALFVADEAVRQRFPFDGFPWGRLAFSQPTGAFLPLASLGGAPLVTFAVALAGAGLAVLARRLSRRYVRGKARFFTLKLPSGNIKGVSRAFPRVRGLVAPVAAVVVPVVAGLVTWPLVGTAAQAGTATVAAVQGNAPNIGLRLLNDGDVLWRNNVAQARTLTRDVRSGAVPKPDLVIFPETVATLRSADSAVVAELADLVGAPIALGARIVPPHGRGRNVVVGWNPGRGRAGEYTKQKLVPFGEYVPLRAVASWFTPFMNRESDLLAGYAPGVMRIGPAKVGFAICYEVAYDAPLRGAVRHGAQLLAVPTNNEWYGRTAASYQQLAMARERAVEHGRAVAVAATTGVSAIIRPDGSIVTESSLFTSTDLEARVPLRDSITVADRVGPWSEWTLTLLGLLGVAAGVGSRVRTRRAGGRGGAVAGKDANGRDGRATGNG